MNRAASVFVVLASLAALLILGQTIGLGVEEGKVPTDTASSGAVSHPKDVITIDHKGYIKDRKGPVVFTHKKHALDYKISCWQCHHAYNDGKNIWVPWGETKNCIECHDPTKKEVTNTKLQKAFHYSCKRCHRALGEKKEKSGPYKKCSGCHENKS